MFVTDSATICRQESRGPIDVAITWGEMNVLVHAGGESTPKRVDVRTVDEWVREESIPGNSNITPLSDERHLIPSLRRHPSESLAEIDCFGWGLWSVTNNSRVFGSMEQCCKGQIFNRSLSYNLFASTWVQFPTTCPPPVNLAKHNCCSSIFYLDFAKRCNHGHDISYHD